MNARGPKHSLVLRWALAWAALTGEFVSIAVNASGPRGVVYEFILMPRSVRRWTERNAKLRAKRNAERAKTEQHDGVEVFDGLA